MVSLHNAFPGMKPAFEEQLQRQVFNLADHIKTRPHLDAVAIDGKRATARLTVDLTFTYTSSGQRGASKLRYDAVLIQHSGGWAITALRPVS